MYACVVCVPNPGCDGGVGGPGSYCLNQNTLPCSVCILAGCDVWSANLQMERMHAELVDAEPRLKREYVLLGDARHAWNWSHPEAMGG